MTILALCICSKLKSTSAFRNERAEVDLQRLFNDFWLGAALQDVDGTFAVTIPISISV